MLFDGAALAEGMVVTDSAEPPPPVEGQADDSDRQADDALLAEETSTSESPDVATTQQDDEEDADAALLAEEAEGSAEAEATDDASTDAEEESGETETTIADASDPQEVSTSGEERVDVSEEEGEDEVGGLAASDQIKELVVVDARVDNYENLLVDMPSNVTVLVVGTDEDGLVAIRDELASGSQTFGAIHIISHGTSGSFTLGTDTVDSSSLSSHSETLQGWAQYLTEDADILLYGCDTAEGSEGQDFLQELSHITGADVAASTDATGASDQGGNWVLEAQVGVIEAGVVLNAAATDGYAGLLAATSVVDSNAASTRTTPEDTPLAITGVQVNGDASTDVITLSVVTSGGVSSLGVTTGLSFTGANGSDSYSITGTIADVNIALGSLTYTPELNQNSSTAGFTPSIEFNVTAGGAGSVIVDNIAVTAVNDAPDLSTQVDLVVSEGASASFSLDQLATSGAALDADIGTGQQVLDQQMVQITSLPTEGTLTYQGGVVVVGTVVPVSNLGQLLYTHNGNDLTATIGDSFGVNVSDGGGAVTAGTIGVTIEPVNADPTITGEPSLVEGQVAVVAPTIDLGDAADSLATSTIVIDNIVTGGQGVFFLDANGNNIVDAGEEISGSVELTPDQAANLSTQLMFSHNGEEPNAPGAVAPSYQITVTDAGGATGVPSGPVSETITLEVQPNNDDPTLDNAHDTPGTAVGVGEGTTVTFTNAMLQVNDVDRNPADTSQTTPTQQLVYTVETRPTEGEIQVFVGGGLGPDGSGWVVLGDGGRFTQAQVDAGLVRYYQTTEVATDTLDGFTFTVRDSSFGYDVVTDPANPTGGREGGVRDTPTGPIAVQSFFLNVTADADPHENIYTGGPRPATAGHGGENMVYNFDAGTMSNGNGAATWNEANVGAAGGYVITDSMLSYEVTRTDTQGTPDTADDVSVVVPPSETVFTLTSQPSNGTVQRFVGGVWETISTNGQFTQEDINSGNIRFVHDGSEDHTTSFDYTVSDGTPNNFSSSFGIDVTPTNDRPTGDGGTAQVVEGDGNNVRLGTDVVGLADIDLSQDPTKQVDEGAEDFLWFQVTDLPDHGELQRWNGSAWVTVTTDTWLPSTLLSTAADGDTSGLRYVHDGSEPLTYAGGPRVDFSYVVRDDLADPLDAFATDLSAPPLADGSQQANQSAPVQAIVDVIPVNNGPQIADTPVDADPTIDATITDGGTLTGANEILENVAEGSTVVITSAHLSAVDPDNTTVQRQYRITNATSEGTLLLNGSALGVGSTFTQADIDAGRLSYRHSGNEVGAITNGFGAQYHDKFHFVVNDGVLEDSGATADDNVFLITLTPTNDKPEVTMPAGPLDIDSTNPANNAILGVSVSDPDLADGLVGGEADFIQVTVRLLDAAGNPVTDYSNVNGPGTGGVDISVTPPADTTGLWLVTQTGNNNILQIQGTQAQVNEALASLTVTFANDLNAEFQLQVIADDRLRDGAGALDASGSDANGGELNEPADPSGTPTAVPGTEYNWLTQATLAADDPNITSDTVDLRASHTNEPAVFTGPPSVIVNEDVRTQVDGFVVEDPESEAFGTPVTVTVSVPAGTGTLGVGTTGAQGSITPAGGQAVTVTGDNSTTITLTGRAIDIEALLNGRNADDTGDDANGGLFFTSALHANGDVNGGADGDVTLTLSLNDAGSQIGDDVGAGSVENNPADITTGITITAINDAPVVVGGGAVIAISDSDPTAVGGFQVTDVDSLDGYTDGETDGVIQVTVRLLDDGGTPLTLADYTTLGVTLDSTAVGSGASVDATLNGNTSALEVRGTRDEINAYLAGLQVTFANIGDSNLDTTYSVEVVADDRLRDAGTGAFTDPVNPVANGGENNQQSGEPAVPSTDTFDAYGTTVSGYGVYNVTSDTRDLFISSINDPGQITANDVVVSEGSATLVLNTTNANIVLGDPDDNGASTMEVTVTVGTGTITAVGGAGGSVAGVGTATITITGATEAEINTRLQSLTVTFPDPDGVGPSSGADWNGSFDVTVVYDDRGNTGTRPGSLAGDTDAPGSNPGDYAYADGTSNHLVTTRVFNVAVNAVNDAPTATTGTVTLPAETEDTDGTSNSIGALFGGTFADARDEVPGGTSADGFAGVAITTNASVPAQGVWQYSTNGGISWLDIPAVSTTSAFLVSTTDLVRFNPADDFHGTPGNLTVRLVDDSSGAITTGDTANVDGVNSGGTTPYSDASNAVTLDTTVTNVNDRPTGTDTTLLNTTEDTANPPGETVANLFGPGYGDTTDDQTGTAGGADAATPLGGIAIVGNTADSTNEGVWQYNTGSGWTTVGVPTGNTALILPPDASLRFLPVANYNGTPGTLTVHVADSAQVFSASTDISGTLGTTSTWSETIVLDTVVDPVNDAPNFSHDPTDPTVTENGSTGSGTSIDPVSLLSGGAVTDIDLSTTPGLDSNVFGAGSVTAQLTDGIAGDVLQLGAGLVPGSNGIASVVGGTGSTPLVITFTAGATVSEVQSVLAAIEYTNTSDDPTNLLSGTPQTTRDYSITLSDGNNVDADSDHAGGPAPLDQTKTGTITINAVNDPPVATDNTNSVTEDTGIPATGNVITDATPDSDPDTPLADLQITGIRTGTEGAGGPSTPVPGATVIVGEYGTLTINPDGSYTYVLDDTNPDVDGLSAGDPPLEDVFTYTLSDGTSTDQAQLTITINGNSDPVVNIPDVNGGEPGHHSIPENATTPVTGTVTIVHPDGAAFIDFGTVTVGGNTTTITNAELQDLATTPIVITGPEGTLTLTDFDSTTGEVTYSYQQHGMTKDHSGGPESVFDTFTFEVTDTNGNTSTPQDLVVVVTDTVPVALPDTNTVAEGVGTNATTTSGNVMVPPGASTGDVQDLLGADATTVVGLDTGTSIGDLSGNIGTSFAGTYGTIVLNADGTYTYTLDNRNPAVQRLNRGQTLTEVFRYTIMDADGDVSTTTLTITITGVSDTLAEPSLPPTQPPAAPSPERPISGNGQLELPRNEIRYQRLDIDQIADRLRPTLYVLPAVQEARELVQGKGVDIDQISDIMDPSLYVLPAVQASSRQASDAAQPAIDRFNDSDTDDDGVVIEWADNAEAAPANADKAQASEAERPAAVPVEKHSTPVQSLGKPDADTNALTHPVARVEFTEQLRQWAGNHSIRQRAAELDLLFDEPASAEATPSPQVADIPQA